MATDTLDSLKWVKWFLLFAAISSVFAVDKIATSRRAGGQITENIRDLGMLWKVSHDLLETKGLTALPVQHQNDWESLDIYTVSKEGYFATQPRFLGTSWANVECNTVAVTMALSGNKDCRIINDYRGESVISAFGLASLPNGEDVALVVEMDVAEAVGVAPSNYWDEILVLIFNSVCGCIIYFVHKQRKKDLKIITELADRGRKAIDTNAKLKAEIVILKASLEKDGEKEAGTATIMLDRMDEMIGMQSVSEWPDDEGGDDDGD